MMVNDATRLRSGTRETTFCQELDAFLDPADKGGIRFWQANLTKI